METFSGVTILLPAMDETYSLSQTVDTIMETCNKTDIVEFIFLLSDKTTKESRTVAESLVKKYSSEISVYIYNQNLPFVGGGPYRKVLNWRKGVMLL